MKGQQEYKLHTDQLKAPTHFQNQSDNLISCYRKPVEWTNEIAYPMSSHNNGLDRWGWIRA